MQLLWRIIVVVLLCVFCCGQASAQPLTVLTHDLGASNYQDERKQAAGYTVVLVREMMSRLNEPCAVRVVPWARGCLHVRKDSNVILFPMARTRARNNRYQWVGPLCRMRAVIVARKDFSLVRLSMDQVRNSATIGYIAGDARLGLLDEMGFKRLSQVHGLHANLTLVKMLDAGRLDLIVTSRDSLLMAVNKLDMDLERFKEVMSLDTHYLYIAFSESTPREKVLRWQRELDKMKAEGSYERLLLQEGAPPQVLTYDDPNDYGAGPYVH